jgi:hypothetical protein
MAHSETDLALLKRHPRAIYHLRTQLHRGRLMPMFGAGLSRPLDLPDWMTLIDRISAHDDVKGDVLDAQTISHASRTQMLYQHFRRSYLQKLFALGDFQDVEAAQERIVHSRWIELVHECLYNGAKSPAEHPYLKSFLPLISEAPLTVNYNFDDSIQELMDAQPKVEGAPTYETVWDPTVQFRSGCAAIYHPNGFLPKRFQRGPSERVVFAEDSFADQLIDVQRGHYATLLSHLHRFTALLVGLSLDDPTLKNLLRQSLHANPGHVHYYIAFVKDDEKDHDDKRSATRDSNFEAFNLVTLHLRQAEIDSVARLLTMPAAEFARCVHDAKIPTNYVFYLTGAVGTGKTTVLAKFKNLTTYPEWLDPKPPELHKAANTLSKEERKAVDDWVDLQFGHKNALIQRDVGQIILIDRTPLDPLAFAFGNEEARLGSIREAFKSNEGNSYNLVGGEIILMIGNPQVLEMRVRQRHKDGSVDYVDTLQQRFSLLWQKVRTRSVSTVDLPLFSVVRRIARIIHFEEYVRTDLSGYVATDLAAQIAARQ